LVCVLKGAINFMADLMRAIELRSKSISWRVVVRRCDQDECVVRIVKDWTSICSVATSHREDVVDSGLTLNYLRQYLGARSPRASRSVRSCSKTRATVEQSLKYVGFTIPADFVVGTGST